MKNIRYLAQIIILFASVDYLYAQSSIGENFYISENDTVFFANHAEVKSGGLLENDGGNLYFEQNVKGDSNIKLSTSANVTISSDTLSVLNETDEEFKNCTLGNSGILEVPAGHSLTLNGNFTNNNSDTGIFLLASASGYSQLLTTGTVTNKGTLKAEQYLTSTVTEGWRQISSPVDATLTQIDDDFQTYYPNAPGNIGANNQWNVYWYDASPLVKSNLTGLDPTDAGAASATYWTAAGNNAMAIGPSEQKAYNLYAGGPFTILNNNTLDFAGAFGNSDYTYNCYQTHDKGAAPLYNGSLSLDPNQITGWNLIPNPYPSNIDVSTLLADNVNFDLAYKAVHVWDATAQQYIAITDNVAIIWNTSASAGTSVNIAPFQAFWVKAYDGNKGSSTAMADHDIKLTNAHRTIEDNANYFKTTPPLIRLNLEKAGGVVQDQTVIAFEDEHNIGLEHNDAFKLKSQNKDMPALYTQCQGSELSINRLPNPEPLHVVPLNVENLSSRIPYKISMVEENIDAGWSIILEDLLNGRVYDLRSGDYRFENEEGFTGTRFKVYINKESQKTDPSAYENIVVYGNDDGINVAFANVEGDKAEVLISNLAGQIVYHGVESTNTLFTYPTSERTTLYIVHVTINNKTKYSKIVK